jgi:hypothetical protein
MWGVIADKLDEPQRHHALDVETEDFDNDEDAYDPLSSLRRTTSFGMTKMAKPITTRSPKKMRTHVASSEQDKRSAGRGTGVLPSESGPRRRSSLPRADRLWGHNCRRRDDHPRHGTRVPAPQGSANLRYGPGNKTLTVATSASSLAPGGAQVGHGTCEPQGTAKYPLNDLVALASGAAYQATVIQTVDQAPAYFGVVSIRRRKCRRSPTNPVCRDPMVRACFRGPRTPGTFRRVHQAPRATGRCIARCGADGAGRCSGEHAAGRRHR